jgi:hypothetical protein
MSLYDSDGNRQQTYSKQHFLDTGSNLRKILNKILKNDTLIKLLYYNSSNVDSEPNLTNEQKVALVNDLIRLYPRLPKDSEFKNYIVIQMDAFNTIDDDYLFRGFTLTFDVFCHVDNWIMDDYMLRPLKILHELDSMFNNSKLDSLGPVVFLGSDQIVLNEDMMGYSIYFRIVNFQ